MVIPKRKEDYENKSVEELVKEQQEIMKQIINFENMYILNTEVKVASPIISPSPTVRWRVNFMNLVMITESIDEKTRDENGVGMTLNEVL